jgi:hypothetical protein
MPEGLDFDPQAFALRVLFAKHKDDPPYEVRDMVRLHLARALLASYTSLRWPLRVLPREEWVSMFRKVGFYNGLAPLSDPPTEPVRLYRAVVDPAFVRGLSWSPQQNNARQHGPRIFATDAPPESILAVMPHSPLPWEHGLEYFVDLPDDWPVEELPSTTGLGSCIARWRGEEPPTSEEVELIVRPYAVPWEIEDGNVRLWAPPHQTSRMVEARDAIEAWHRRPRPEPAKPVSLTMPIQDPASLVAWVRSYHGISEPITYSRQPNGEVTFTASTLFIEHLREWAYTDADPMLRQRPHDQAEAAAFAMSLIR